MVGYYDLVLGLIPLALGGIVATLTVAGFDLTTAVSLASAVTVGLIGHALFVNGPVDSPSGQAGTPTPDETDSFRPAD